MYKVWYIYICARTDVLPAYAEERHPVLCVQGMMLCITIYSVQNNVRTLTKIQVVDRILIQN